MSRTPQEQREDIAAVIRGAVNSQTTVYAAPPASEVIPCVVIGPRTPYRERSTFGGELVHLTVTVVLPPPASGLLPLDAIDAIVTDVMQALLTDPGLATLQWERVQSVGQVVTRAGVECIAATIDITTGG